MASLKFRFDMAGLKDIEKRLADLRQSDKVVRESGNALFKEATKIMNASKQLVPVDQGQLIQSGHVQLPAISGNRVTVTLGYAAPYAIYVHENPRAGQTQGLAPVASFNNPFAASIRQRHYKHWATKGTWKFLSTPYLAWKQGALQIFADQLRASRAISLAARKLAA